MTMALFTASTTSCLVRCEFLGGETAPCLYRIVFDAARAGESYLLSLTFFPPADAPEGNYVLQTIYSPNNAAAPPSFFQCADVQVLHPNTTNFAHKHAGY